MVTFYGSKIKAFFVFFGEQESLGRAEEGCPCFSQIFRETMEMGLLFPSSFCIMFTKNPGLLFWGPGAKPKECFP